MAFTFNFGGFNPDWFNPANFNGNQEGEAEGGQQSHQNPFAQRPKKERKPRKAIGNAFTRTLINLGVTILFALVYFYVELPALNFHSEDLYVFVFLVCAVYCAMAMITSGFQADGVKGYVGFVKKQCAVPFLVFIGLIAAIAIGAISSWVLAMSAILFCVTENTCLRMV